MKKKQIGYLEIKGCFYHFTTARCAFRNGLLDIEAEGQTYRLKIYGIPFKGVEDISQLAAKKFESDSQAQTREMIAEGGILFEDVYFSWQTILIRCGQFNTADNTLFLMVKGTLEDDKSKKDGPVDGTLICDVQETLW